MPPMDLTWTDTVEFDALPIRVYFVRSPSQADILALDELIVGWHRVGVCGGFEGTVHDAQLNGVRREDATSVYEAVLDVGSAPRLAVDVFVRALEGLGRHIEADRAELGWREGE